MKPLQVVFISHEASRTGAPIILLHLLRWLRANTDLRFGVVSVLGGPLEAEFRELAPCWTLIPERLRGATRTKVGRWAQELAVRLQRRWVRAQVARTRPSLFYYNTVTTGWVANFFAPLGVPSVYHIHELDWVIQTIGPRFITEMTQRGSLFIAASFAVGTNLTAKYGVPAENLTVVPEFIEVPEVPPGDQGEDRRKFLERVGLPRGAWVVGGVGSTELRKGVDLFGKVAALLSNTNEGRPVHFVWLGGAPEGAFARQVMEEAVREGAGDRLHFLPGIARPFEVMRHFDVFAMTSREDPYPLVMLEAAALSKPIVCFDGAGGPPEFVGEDAGFAVPHLDVQAMAGRIAEILEFPPLASRMGRAGRQRVLSESTVGRAAPRILEIIRPFLKS